MSQLKIDIEIRGTDSSSKKTVKIDSTGASVREICDKAGIDPKNMEFTVNGVIATGDTHVGQSDVFKAKERAQPVVRAEARPQGS